MNNPRQDKTRRGKEFVDPTKNKNEPNFEKAFLLSKTEKSLSLNWFQTLVQTGLILNKYETGSLQSNDELVSLYNKIDEILDGTEDEFKVELYILKCKILYFKGQQEESVTALKQLNLIKKPITNYSYRAAKLTSEALAIIGLYMSSLDSEDFIQELFNSVLISITHFQEISNQNDGSSDLEPYSIGNLMSYLIESAAKKFFLIKLNCRKQQEAVDWLRLLMRFKETPYTKNLRRMVSKDLAEYFLRSMNPLSFIPLMPEKNFLMFESLKKFRMPEIYLARNVVPTDTVQESILLLLISDFLANPNAILDRSPDYAEEREKIMRNTIEIYNLLTVALVRSSSFSFLYERLESSLRFSFKEFHIWYQFALALINSKKFYRAYLVLRECQRINPQKTGVYLLAISICLGNLGMIEEGIDLCHEAIKVASKNNEQFLLARANLLLGWGYHLAAKETRVMNTKSELHWKAIEYYRKSVSLNPNDANAWYHLSVELANQRQLIEALVAVKRSLCLNPIQSSSFLLLSLLHSAMPQNPVQNSVVGPIQTKGNPVTTSNNIFSFNNNSLNTSQLNNNNSSSNEDIANTKTQEVSEVQSAAPANAEIKNTKDGKSEEPKITSTANILKDKEGSSCSRDSYKKRKLDSAVKALEAGLLENPYDIDLLFTLAKLELIRTGFITAKNIYIRLVEVWRRIYGGDNSVLNFISNIYQNDCLDCISLMSDGTLPRYNGMRQLSAGQTGTILSATSVPGSFVSNHQNSTTELTANMIKNQNTFTAGQGQKNSIGQITPANTISDCNNKVKHGQNHHSICSIPSRIYIALAELYLHERKLEKSEVCLQQLPTKTEEVQFLIGRLQFERSNFQNAKDKFESILAKNPDHTDSLVELARIHFINSNYIQAERVIRQAINNDPMRSQSWRVLGDILSNMQVESVNENFDLNIKESLDSIPGNQFRSESNLEGVSCQSDLVPLIYMKAIELENTEPILPFLVLPVGFKL